MGRDRLVCDVLSAALLALWWLYTIYRVAIRKSSEMVLPKYLSGDFLVVLTIHTLQTASQHYCMYTNHAKGESSVLCASDADTIGPQSGLISI